MTERMTAAELRAHYTRSGKGRKYRNKPTDYASARNGVLKCASQLEARMYAWLDRMLMEEIVDEWFPQMPIRLGCDTEGGKARVMVVDALVFYPDGPPRWLDAKGRATEAWILKRDMVRSLRGIEVELWKGRG